MLRIYSLLLLVMVAWGFNVSALVVLVRAFDPLTLTAVRIMVAGVAVLLLTRFMGIFRLPTREEGRAIVLIMLFNVALHHALLALGLTKTSGANASIILGSLPLLTMILSVIFLRQSISWARVLGFVLGFIGVFWTSVVTAGGIGQLSSGDGFVFLSILSQAFSFILISRLSPELDPRLLTGYMLLIGSGLLLLLAGVIEGDFSQLTALFDLKLAGIFLFSAVGATAFGHMIYNYAVRYVGPAETAIFANLNTVFALIGSSLFLGETILLAHVIGLLLIILGIFFGTGSFEYIVKKRHERK